METVFSGGCLCGAVRYESTAAPVVCGHCQCDDCRRSSGSGHCSHAGVPKAAVRITGNVSTYDKAADSGNMVTRAFCGTCGAATHSLNSAMPDLIFLRASSLDDLEVFQPQLIVYAARAASWDHMDPALPAFAEVPPPDDMPIKV